MQIDQKPTLFRIFETVPSEKGVHYQLTTNACNALIIAGITGVASILGKMILDAKKGMPTNGKAAAFLITAATTTILGLFCRIYRQASFIPKPIEAEPILVEMEPIPEDNLNKGYAPNKQAAAEYLTGNRSIVPGSYVFYPEKNSSTSEIYINTTPKYEEISKLHVNSSNTFTIGHPTPSKADYLASGQIINGKPWEKHLHYLDAIEIFRRECPPDHFWMEVLINGKIVYMYQTTERSVYQTTERSNGSILRRSTCIRCVEDKTQIPPVRDNPAPEYLPLDSTSETTTPRLAEALLSDKSKKIPLNAFIPIHLYDFKDERWCHGVCFKDGDNVVSRLNFPTGKSSEDYATYKFSDTDLNTARESFNYSAVQINN
jgi:hypothetical protein